ncbi:hypothetical protein VST7929_00480 [Vibrio stylophorae]|uniref:Uncharacterized protein n=2 Tax=Vibrio stylophorae TaxID=659351 RepID=A0ABN8DPG3_9VIBR|nr:hypothetical protein VST7929_00480 [Vibrio stylophorae]
MANVTPQQFIDDLFAHIPQTLDGNHDFDAFNAMFSRYIKYDQKETYNGASGDGKLPFIKSGTFFYSECHGALEYVQFRFDMKDFDTINALADKAMSKRPNDSCNQVELNKTKDKQQFHMTVYHCLDIC